MSQPPRMLSRRSFLVVIITGFILGALFFASGRIGECPGGDCIKNKLPFRPHAGGDKVSTEPPASGKTGNGDRPKVDLDEEEDADFAVEIPESDSKHDGEDKSKVPSDAWGKPKPGDDDTSEDLNEGILDDEDDEDASDNSDETTTEKWEKSHSCKNFPDTSNVLVVMKTGASEVMGKVPTQIMTNLKCVHEYLIFSDMAQTVAGVEIHDSLDTVRTEISKTNNDFHLYWRQQQCPVDPDLCNKYHDAASEGWALDKYKNNHIAEKTYAMRPDYDWYLFTDADTYVIWPTMMQWLSKMDAKKKHYIGSVAMLGDFPFGHGGSGYLVSGPSMKAMFEGKKNVANVYDKAASETCCGDYMFAFALRNETGIDVKNVWPVINGEKPITLQYGDNQWCQPITTMHHIGAEEVSEFEAFEQEREFSYPMRIKDIFHKFVEPQLIERRDNWDNGADDEYLLDLNAPEFADWEKDRAKKEGLTDTEKTAFKSWENCRDACKEKHDCLQFNFHNQICKIGRKIQLGAPVKGQDDENARWRYRSGWNLERIEKWVKDNDKCGDVSYPNP